MAQDCERRTIDKSLRMPTPQVPSSRSLLQIAVVVISLIAGCHPGPTEVTGQVTLDGEPLRIDKNVRGTVVFEPTSRHGPTLTGIVDRSGGFQLMAGSSSWVNPGDYLVTVSAVKIQKPTLDNPVPFGQLITPARYADCSTSGLRTLIEAGKNQVLLELESEESSYNLSDGDNTDETTFDSNNRGLEQVPRKLDNPE